MTCAHPPRLIRVFGMRSVGSLGSNLSCGQWRLWSDWAHRSFCWFCHAAAHIFICFFRLPIVHSPINRESMCKPTTTPDGRTVYKCPFCSKDFVSFSDINRHMDFHEGKRKGNRKNRYLDIGDCSLHNVYTLLTVSYRTRPNSLNLDMIHTPSNRLNFFPFIYWTHWIICEKENRN